MAYNLYDHVNSLLVHFYTFMKRGLDSELKIIPECVPSKMCHSFLLNTVLLLLSRLFIKGSVILTILT